MVICYTSHRTVTQTLLCRILEVRVSLKADRGWIAEPLESALGPRNPKAVAGHRNVEGSVGSPSLRVPAAHGLPRFLRLYKLGISISILIQDF